MPKAHLGNRVPQLDGLGQLLFPHLQIPGVSNKQPGHGGGVVASSSAAPSQWSKQMMGDREAVGYPLSQLMGNLDMGRKAAPLLPLTLPPPQLKLHLT